MKKKRKKILKKLKKPFRLIVLNENSFEERFSYSLTPMNVIVMIGGFLVVFSLLFYSLIAFTPLRTVLIPDFTSYESRADARKARLMADSLSNIMKIQEHYFNDLKIILSGGNPVSSIPDSVPKGSQSVDLNYVISDVDQATREELDHASAVFVTQARKIPEAGYLLFPPVAGSISSNFEPQFGKKGVNWTCIKNETVKSVLDGTVISSSYTVSDGNTMLIQHPNNMVSAYKNLAVLFKQNGEAVKAGEGIGWVSENANGLGQFYFEIWKNSAPVDPKTYFAN
ncbi:MAG: M23 family metallopeptidase [Flavobacteriales bacterium]|nr:M23 family metallopeptidase [Flavobacteriales bacterium]MDP4716836.1 M23 family metallopeptidase [Flavobacteriales bacterium]MDP4819348.1 M23 family metallopeptidase [Flavobacteriales bacterium]MDP5075009.1 M23 family metallopeptidase [Flavobacteriales bacterium]